MTTTLRPAASYARISEKTEARDKIADQHRQNERHAKARGYRIVARYQDNGISGLGHKTRQGFRDMLDAAGRQEFEVIVATEEERLARNVQEKLELHEVCADAAVVWDTGRDGFVDPQTDAGEFVSTIRAAVGRIESKRKARRQLAANAERIAEGLPVPGKTRYGYNSGNITLVPHEAEKVRALFVNFLDGQSIRSIGIQMGWRAERVRATLANPAYAGYVVRHGELHEAHDSVGRVVDRETFNKVQALLNAPARRTTPGSAPRHLLSGLALCGVCKTPLVFRNNYLCLRDLAHPCIRKGLLETKVRREVVRALTFDPIEDIPETARLHAIDLRQTAIEVAKSGLVESIEYGAKAKEVGPRIRRLEEENKVLSAERERIVGASVSLALVHDLRSKIFEGGRASIERAAEVKIELGARFDALDLEQQRDLVRGLLAITVFNGRGAGRIRIDRLNDEHRDEEESFA